MMGFCLSRFISDSSLQNYLHSTEQGYVQFPVTWWTLTSSCLCSSCFLMQTLDMANACSSTVILDILLHSHLTPLPTCPRRNTRLSALLLLHFIWTSYHASKYIKLQLQNIIHSLCSVLQSKLLQAGILSSSSLHPITESESVTFPDGGRWGFTFSHSLLLQAGMEFLRALPGRERINS